jgi:hypothetical protein
MSQTIFIDETGYTGQDLLEANQPIFALASHTISEKDSRFLLESCFKHTQAPEIKHTTMRRTESGRRNVIKLVDSIKKNGTPIKLYPVHKRFALFIRFFDYFAEQSLHRNGINAYADANNVTFTNYAFLHLEEMLGTDFMTDLLFLFQKAMKERSEDNYDRMWKYLASVTCNGNAETKKIIAILLRGQEVGITGYLALPKNALDLSLTILMALVAEWKEKDEDSFILIHDQSTNLAKMKETWDWLSSTDQQKAILGYGDYRQLRLPLNVVKTEFPASTEYAGLQVADVLVGAHVEVMRRLIGISCHEYYADQLIDSGLSEVINHIWPVPGWRPPIIENAPEMTEPFKVLGRMPVGKRT